MRAPGGRLALLAAVCSLAVVQAVFEDQLGSKDWYKQQIGAVTSAAFHQNKPRVCVATAQSVVGCLNLRDGSVVWRKLVGTEPGAATSVALTGHGLLAADGQYMRAFDLEGNLKWWRSVPQPGSLPLLRLSAPSGQTATAQVLTADGATLQVRSCVHGAHVTCSTSPNP
jgi:hypothetical protein